MAANSFIDISAEEQALELAAYVAELIEKEEYGMKAEEDIAAGKLSEVIDGLLKNAHIFYGGEKDIESVFNALVRLVTLSNTDHFVTRLADILAMTQIEEFALQRLRILTVLFNLQPPSPLRADVFLRIIQHTQHTHQCEAIVNQLSLVEGWLKEWNSPLDQARQVHRAVFGLLQDNGNDQGSCSFLMKLLATYNGTGSAAIQPVKSDAAKLVATILRLPDMFELDQVLALDAVAELKAEKINDILSFFVKGDLAGYTEWHKQNAAVLETYGLNHEQNVRKLRLLSLASLCAASPSVDFKAIQETLGIQEEDIETWIIDGIRVGLIEAKIDELNEKVNVTRSTHATFGMQQWEDLKGRLESWRKHIGDVQKVLVSVQAKMRAQTAQASGKVGK